jgi:hypothetical protein
VFPTAWSEKRSDALAKLIVARERILGGSSAAFPHARTAALSGSLICQTNKRAPKILAAGLSGRKRV